jgi:hypothetical protein
LTASGRTVVVAGSGLYLRLTWMVRWPLMVKSSGMSVRDTRRVPVGDLGMALNETMVLEEAWVRVTWVVPDRVEWVVRR